MRKSFSSRFLAGLLCLGLGLASVYVFPSGQPQPTDLVLVVFMASVFLLKTRDVLGIRPTGFIYLLGGFVAYTLLLTCVWFFILQDVRMLIFPAFYIYNFLILLTLYVLMQTNPAFWFKALRWGLMLAIVVGFGMLVIKFDFARARQTGGFNNPNQLGYFGLVSLCSLVLVHRRQPFSMRLLLIAVLLCSVLVATSFSLTAAAALGIVFVGMALMYWNDVRLLRDSMLVGCVLVIVGMFYAVDIEKEYLADRWDSRLNALERKTENVSEERGYERILLYPEYVIAGAGEGALHRYGKQRGYQARIEIHSTFGMLVFSYGIPGMVMIVGFLYMIIRQPGLGTKLIVSAPFVYSLTHQGLRSTGFWLFLLLLVLEAQRSSRLKWRQQTLLARPRTLSLQQPVA